MRYSRFLVLALILAPPAAALAQADPDFAEQVRARLATVAPAATCSMKVITCGQTIQSHLGDSGCMLSNGNNVDYYKYTFTGPINQQQLNISLTTTTYNPFLELIDPNQNLVNSAFANSPGLVQINTALPADGDWTIAATNSGAATTGNYTLSLTCGGGTPTCVENDTTLCVGNNRFQVRATFAANGSSGDAHAVALTGDTGYLWFFSSGNVETVIKVLNACALNNRYWVFAGGLTNVHVVITVTDLKTQTTKTYMNPANTEFQPIQDTNAFATCP
jgi:hypothetical protein